MDRRLFLTATTAATAAAAAKAVAATLPPTSETGVPIRPTGDSALPLGPWVEPESTVALDRKRSDVYRV